MKELSIKIKQIKNNQMINLNTGYAPINLELFDSFEEKLNTTVNYLQINSIFCGPAIEDFPAADPMVKYIVNEVIVPPGRSVWIKTLLREIQPALEESLLYFVQNDDDFDGIKSTLKRLKDKCANLYKDHNIENTYLFENGFQYKLEFANTFYPIYPYHLKIDAELDQEIRDQFSVRRDFFGEIYHLIDQQLQFQQDIPSFPRQPYKWNSEHPHLEIAELVHALMQTKLKFTEGEKGSTSKFIKQFYNLFGYDSSLFHSKAQQLRQRENTNSWMRSLSDYIETSVGKKETETKN